MALTTIVVSKNTTLPEISRLVQEAKGDAVVIVFARYLMSPNYNDVILAAEVVVCAKSDALGKIVVPTTYAGHDMPVLYRNKIQTLWQLPDVDSMGWLWPGSNAAAWAKDNAIKLRTALIMAASELAELVCWDMEQPARENYRNSDATVLVQFYADNGNRLLSTKRASIYRNENNRLWVRTRDGCLYAQDHAQD